MKWSESGKGKGKGKGRNKVLAPFCWHHASRPRMLPVDFAILFFPLRRKPLMKRLLCLVCMLGLTLSLSAADAPVVPPKQGKSETIKLFNGTNLDGWEGHEKYWSVKDGVIVGKNTEHM